MKVEGSLMNCIMHGSGKNIVPEVGMGATELLWSDRHAYTVIEVSKSGKTVTVQRDNAERVLCEGENPMSDSQNYKYTPDPKGAICKIRLCKNGWKEIGGGSRFALGFRDEYYDYSF